MAKIALGRVKGDPGRNVHYLGKFDSEDTLKQQHEQGDEGDFAYIGRDLYIWGLGEWSKVESMAGADGAPGKDGAVGPKGDKGDSAGFGTISATVDDIIGTPGVSVADSGPDTAKNLEFSFTGLKGATGPTGPMGPAGAVGPAGPTGPAGAAGPAAGFDVPTATIANTTGTPTVTVTATGPNTNKKFSFAFAGLKGETGSDATITYPITVARGGTGQTTIPLARSAFGLGNTAGAVPIANGGTGATDAATARSNLGIPLPLAVASGGTGATDAVKARANLGIPLPLAVASGGTGPNLTLPLANGGTGATTAANARHNLGIDLPLSVENGGTGINVLSGEGTYSYEVIKDHLELLREVVCLPGGDQINPPGYYTNKEWFPSHWSEFIGLKKKTDIVSTAKIREGDTYKSGCFSTMLELDYKIPALYIEPSYVLLDETNNIVQEFPLKEFMEKSFGKSGFLPLARVHIRTGSTSSSGDSFSEKGMSLFDVQFLYSRDDLTASKSSRDTLYNVKSDFFTAVYISMFMKWDTDQNTIVYSTRSDGVHITTFNIYNMVPYAPYALLSEKTVEYNKTAQYSGNRDFIDDITSVSAFKVGAFKYKIYKYVP